MNTPTTAMAPATATTPASPITDVGLCATGREECIPDLQGVQSGNADVSRTDRMALAQSAAKDTIQAMLNGTYTQVAGTCEDSYATRFDLHRRIRDLTFALCKVMTPVEDTIDLGKVLVDYGHDPEAAASDHACGIEHESEADRARAEHSALIGRLAPTINTLRLAGFSVLTELTFVPPSEQEADEYLL